MSRRKQVTMLMVVMMVTTKNDIRLNQSVQDAMAVSQSRESCLTGPARKLRQTDSPEALGQRCCRGSDALKNRLQSQRERQLAIRSGKMPRQTSAELRELLLTLVWHADRQREGR